MEAGFAVGVDEAGRQVYRLDIQYDGSAFYGWSCQPELPTVEGSLRTALGMLIGEEPRRTVAGRTDAGVHARRQVVSMKLPARLDLSLIHISEPTRLRRISYA